MKKLIVKGPVPKSISNCVINDFDEEYALYLRRAKKNWRTKEAFSLEFNSTLSDLLKSYFIYVDREDLELLIMKRLNVIEIIEL